MGVLFDRTGFGLVWFVLFVCGCNIWVSILIYYKEFDEDKAGYWFRDWFAMSRNMTLLVRNMTSLGYMNKILIIS